MKINSAIKKFILKEIFSVYKKKQVKAVILYGSRARGDFNKNSDYDIEVYLDKKKIKLLEKSPSLEHKNIFIDVTDKSSFKNLKKRGHPFLYCTFRDGIPLCQYKEWFKQNKKEVLKIKPSEEVIKHYAISGLERILNLKKNKLFYLDYEDIKSAANQIGFSIMMKHEIYPISPHTLKIELNKLDKKYINIAKTICYLQNIFYENRNPNKNKYKRELNKLRLFSKSYLEEKFPEELETLQKTYKKIWPATSSRTASSACSVL